MITKEVKSPEERRKYIRLDTVFPVQFRILSLDGKTFISDWLQGFTNNIGKGGICLEINHLKPEYAQAIKTKDTKLSLAIETPFSAQPVSAGAKVSWVREGAEQPDRYTIGLAYENILELTNRRIMRYAWIKKLFLPSVATTIILLSLGFALGSYINIKLIRGNKALVEQLVKIIQDSSVAKQKIKEINKEKDDLQLKIQTLQLRIQTVEEEKTKLDEKVKSDEALAAKKIDEFNPLIEKLTQEKAALQEQLIALQNKENMITGDLLLLDRKKATLEKANLDKMYQWLKVHQNPRTGLVLSFEGDSIINQWAFTYDQALVAIVYTHFSDFERAKKLFDFFFKKAKRIDGKFLNAYYANDGSPAEYQMHSGPNIWLGIAVLQYTKKSQDTGYLDLASEIANAVISLQDDDLDGGIRGGSYVSWYSTEHNLDAYAFFNLLYKITLQQKYRDARDKVLNWLLQHTYDRTELPIKRGKGDSTIATDTYAWSIAAIGPEKLSELGMNPDRILEFAEKNCVVEVNYIRPEGRSVKVKGFDFAPQRHLARGGVVSSEWTAQMVLSFKIMADFYYQKRMVAKARSYGFKADEYLAQLGKMIISSPSPSGQGESCLPYATEEFVDTGHGWITPQGKSTGSLAGTAYTILAYYNYNPLELKLD